MQQKLSALDAIRAFYINEELLSKIFLRKLPLKVFEVELQKACEDAKKRTKKELLSYHLDHWGLRYYNYLNAEWQSKEVSLAECGVYPSMSGLPSKMTYGSAMDTAREVRAILDNKVDLSWKNHRVLYIENMARYVEVIIKYIPIILLKGGTIRKMEVSVLKDGKNFRAFPYDIDDGNNRAVALALLGYTRVHAYVGDTLCENPLLKSLV